MNNNEPNNNELNSVFLGNVGNINNVNPTPTPGGTETPPTPQNEADSNLTPVSPLTEENESAILNTGIESNNLNTNINEPNYTNSIPPVAPLMEENSVNNVLSSNIETIPPLADDSNSKKNKDKPNKILFIIIIVLSLQVTK